MRDKVFKRAIIISIAVHLIAICCVGRTSSLRLGASPVHVPQRLIDVALVKDPLAEPPKPKPAPAVVPTHAPETPTTESRSNPSRTVTPTPAAPSRAASNSGGALNTGTRSANGDINIGNTNGRTPVGWVPGNDNGRGQGSGNASGVGTPEPPRPEPVRVPDPPRHVDPPPPPAPKRVTVRICEVSNLLAGDNCKNTHNQSYNEGDEPRRTCDHCKAPEPEHKSRLADHKDPVLVRDPRPRIPDSVEEGLSVSVEIDFYVDTDGGVSDVRVTRSSGNRELDRSAVSAVSQRRYDPAVQDGLARRVKRTCVIPFKT